MNYKISNPILEIPDFSLEADDVIMANVTI